MLFWWFFFSLLVYSIDSQRCPVVEDCVSVLFRDTQCLYNCNPNTYDAGKSKCLDNKLSLLKINNAGDNDVASALLNYYNRPNSYLSVKFSDDGWRWEDGSSVNYSNPLPSTSSDAPRRSTVPPDERRKDMSIDILIDASIYSTPSSILNQLMFFQSLANYVSDRGLSQFAFSFYGCDTTYSSQYFDANSLAVNMEKLNQTLMECTRSNSFSFANSVNDFIYNYYCVGNAIKRKYANQAMIILSSITNSTLINRAPKPSVMPNSQIITISLGPQAASLASLAQPRSNCIVHNNLDDIDGLVKQVDDIMFTSSTYDNDVIQPDSSTDQCVVLRNDSYWQVEDCSTSLNILCTGPAWFPPTLPTQNPLDVICKKDSEYWFSQLNNGKCYQPSTDVMTFQSAVDKCIETTRKNATITSIASIQENFVLSTIVNDNMNEGMFWIGLHRDSSTDPWKWTTGEPVTFLNFRQGYPTPTDGSNCVAFVYEDSKWINIDCQRNLTAICFRDPTF